MMQIDLVALRKDWETGGYECSFEDLRCWVETADLGAECECMQVDVDLVDPSGCPVHGGGRRR